MDHVTSRPVFVAMAALLGAMAGCAQADPTASSDGAGAGSASGCQEGAVEACYSGPPGTEGVAHCKGGERRCEGGKWSPCEGESAPTFEICNGEDEDCDGVADNGNPGAGSPCTTGLEGPCGLGTSVCKEGAIQCIASSTPSAEVCDAVDNDCDGVVDEQVAESGEVCSTGMPGACSAGSLLCVGGAIVCTPWSGPSLETCNGVDDDCDGVIDDDVCATVYLEAVADAEVSDTFADDNSADMNFGSDSIMVLSDWPERRIFVRFDLTSVPINVQILSVRLEMTAASGKYLGSVRTHLVPDDTWDEYVITWNNQPPIEDDEIGSWPILDWGVSDKLCVNDDKLLITPVQEALASDKLISFRLHAPNTDSFYYARESGDVAKRPRLVVRYAQEP